MTGQGGGRCRAIRAARSPLARGTQFSAGAAPAAPTQNSLRFRNAQQDRALAARASKPALQERFGSCDAIPPADNPEWYHRVRDFLFRLP